MKRIIKIIGILLILYLFISYIFPKYIAAPIAAWNSHQVWKEHEKKSQKILNSDDYEIIGVYEFKTENREENHFVFIDTVQNKLTGFYFGTESSGEHGISHFGNPLLDLKLIENRIEFEIGERELYETTRNKIYKPSQKPKEETSIGISKSPLSYSGKLTEFGFKLTCKSEFYDCWENEMEFKRIYD
ncbi:hypothetical protein AWE51_10435 [Aquimarina aggregata]|uniref:Uncharacterized protein n=1 Tax=Aquimarina aggregata TaxID=1642818 RepID=A0A162Y7V6_9FLAO|nr:hypothetical protein [Aquimarina aggregata]KZS38977.1 hypothetical protein AWE51_10435 [Aquimarina aggregata]